MQVLVVEDSPYDAELMALRLQDEGFEFDWQRVQSEPEYSAALQQSPDLILCDWHLPRFTGQRALQLLTEHGLDIPLIIVSGGIGEEAAIDALHQGAADYVLKDRPARLGEAVRRALEERRLRRDSERSHRQLLLAERAFQNTAEGITITDATCNIVSVNPAFEDVTGYSATEVLGRNPRILKSGRHDEAFYAAMYASLGDSGHWRGEIWNRRKNGEIYPEWMTISAVFGDAGEVLNYVAVFSDISQLKQAQDQIDFMARYDALTHLPNRGLFRDRLEHALNHARRENDSLALLFIDLDRFKVVNDTLGHPAGDQLLLEVSRRIGGLTRSSDTLARLGGDEFVLLLEGHNRASDAVTVANKLLRLLSEPMSVFGQQLTITASIGVSLYPSDGDDADTLLSHADRAMYEAKHKGRDSFQFFTPELAEGALDRLLLENALRGAVSRDELLLHYQPQVDLSTGELVSVEALVRWNHPEQGLISPAQFIPMAEEIGVIGDIGRWVLHTACRQAASWNSRGYVVPRIAVNLSVQQIDPERLYREVSEVLDQANLAADQLELEVTESTLMQEPAVSRLALERIKTLGVTLAVDDFGTGYSSLAYLKLLPLDRLKIDQSFVRDIARDGNDETIVRAVIALASSLDLETVAEGVELPTQAAFLRDQGCDLAQGFLYSKPLPADELVARWDKHPQPMVSAR